MSSDLAPVVMVAPGGGRAVRRKGVLLFDPTGDNGKIVGAFDAATSDDEAIAAVKQQLIDAGFEAAPLVVIDWRGEGLDLVVFGEADVHTSTVAAPMLSGAASATWVERHLGDLELRDSPSAELWCGDEVDPDTDLRLGAVRCGGVRLRVQRDVPLADEQPAPIETGASVRSTARQAQVATSPLDHDGPGPLPVIEDAGAASTELSWQDTEPPAPGAREEIVRLGGSSDVDPFGVDDESGPIAREPRGDLFDGSEHTEPATIGGDDLLSADAGVQLIEATVCPSEHPNPPHTTICIVCDADIDGDAAVTLIEQPPVGRLRFLDGQEVPVNGLLVLGRKPALTAPGASPVTVDHAEVSRSHAEVSVEGWAVLLTDLDSRNGTWVTPPNDPTPVKLDGGVPHLLEHGTTIHLGSPEAWCTYLFDGDVTGGSA